MKITVLIIFNYIHITIIISIILKNNIFTKEGFMNIYDTYFI